MCPLSHQAMGLWKLVLMLGTMVIIFKNCIGSMLDFLLTFNLLWDIKMQAFARETIIQVLPLSSVVVQFLLNHRVEFSTVSCIFFYSRFSPLDLLCLTWGFAHAVSLPSDDPQLHVEQVRRHLDLIFSNSFSTWRLTVLVLCWLIRCCHSQHNFLFLQHPVSRLVELVERQIYQI